MGESRFIAAALVLALCAAPVAAQEADEPVQLTPSSAWIMDYADDSCALRRGFAAGEKTAWFELRQFAPSSEFLVTVASSSFKMRSRSPRSRFLPDGPLRKQELAAFGKYGDTAEGVSFPETLLGDSVRLWDDVQRDARERSITGFEVRSSFSEDLILQTGELHRPLMAMRTCLDDLLKHWKIDPDVYRSLKQRAMPLNRRSWAAQVQSYYPTGLLYVSGSPSVVFGLLIDDTGKVETCKVQRPVVDKSYEDLICGIILKHGKFSAALDADGRPVRSLYFLRVVYS